MIALSDFKVSLLSCSGKSIYRVDECCNEDTWIAYWLWTKLHVLRTIIGTLAGNWLRSFFAGIGPVYMRAHAV